MLGVYILMAKQFSDQDPTAVSRKSDHIEMAFQSQVPANTLDPRFNYEPLLSGHPSKVGVPIDFLNCKLGSPIWVSSMTGGTALAGTINHNLARACAEFRLGMGLGSCRQLLFSDEHLEDFDVRGTIGPDLPLYANLGIAQIDQLLATGQLDVMEALVDKLRADGLIIHVNPLQEAMQPEGDHFARSPLAIIEEMVARFSRPIIVKEVGQGFGPESLKALLQLPLAAIEFAAAGGTNFAKLELLRSDAIKQEIFGKLVTVGHTATQMLEWTNQLVETLGATEIKAKHLIISGGIQDFLDGYYLTEKALLPAVYGQASGFLKHARGDYDTLQHYVQAQIEGYTLAKTFLRVV